MGAAHDALLQPRLTFVHSRAGRCKAIAAVVPAKAGTHTPQQSDVAALTIPKPWWLWGPRLRGNDNGLVRVPAFGCERVARRDNLPSNQITMLGLRRF